MPRSRVPLNGVQQRSLLILVVLAAVGAAAPSAEAAQIAQRSDAIGGPNVSGKHDDLFTRDGLASSCADPGVVSSPQLRADLVEYMRYPFRSFVEQPVCVTVTLNTACTGNNEVMSESYSPTYDPNNITVNWIGDLGNSPPAATSYSFTLPPGAQFETVVDERNTGASCTGVTTTWTSDRPWASGRPFIDGVPALGQTVNAEQDVWAESPTVEKQWVRCDAAGANCTDIPGATASQYTPTDADLGYRLSVRETATDGSGTSTTLAPATVRVFIPIDVHAQGLGPGDSSQQGRLNFGLASSCEAPKSPPSLADNNLHLYDAYALTSIVNEPQCVHVAKPLNPCGSSTLAVYSPSFNPAAITQNYVADNGGFNTAMSYTLPPGASAVHVIAEQQLNACQSYQFVIGSDAPFASARPQVGNAPTEGVAVTTSNGSWSGSPAFAYSWQRCDAAGANCVPIGGATGASYMPTAADVGQRLLSRVTATQGQSASADSQPSAVVEPAPGGGAQPAADDRTAPNATLRLARTTLQKVVKRGFIPVNVHCDETSSITVRADVSRKLRKALGGRTIATGKGNCRPGRRTNLKAKLKRKARRGLRRRKSLGFTLKGRATDTAGNTGTATRKATLKRKR
jgi:hypothetical protein